MEHTDNMIRKKITKSRIEWMLRTEQYDRLLNIINKLYCNHNLELKTILGKEYKLCTKCDYTEKHFLHGFSKINRKDIIYGNN